MKVLSVTRKDIKGLQTENLAPWGSGRIEMSKESHGYAQVVDHEDGNVMYEIPVTMTRKGKFEFSSHAAILRWGSEYSDVPAWEDFGEVVELKVQYRDPNNKVYIKDEFPKGAIVNVPGSEKGEVVNYVLGSGFQAHRTVGIMVRYFDGQFGEVESSFLEDVDILGLPDMEKAK